MFQVIVPKDEDVKRVIIESEDVPVKVELPKDSVLKRLVPPHSKKSRLVTNADLSHVIEEIKILHEICFTPSGKYLGAYAMHHSQIDDKDPLSLFVTADHKIIINPVITRHSGYTTDSKEGCVTFSDKERIIVQRWHKIELDFVTIMVDPEDEKKFKLSSIIHGGASGPEAFCFQHELGHGNAEYIYQY